MKNKSSNKKATDGTYYLSQDYLEVYNFLISKNNLVAYVDYYFSENNTARDICNVRRFQKLDISFGVRGLQYGEVSPYSKEDGTEYELFEKECKRLNASFILPN